MSKFKNGDFTIKHLLTDAQYTLNDLFYVNSTDRNNYNKCPLFMAEIKIKQPTLPDGVKFAVTRLEDRPAGKPAPVLYQEILLSYLGNAAKTELEKNDWRPKAMTKLDKVAPEEALANLHPDYKTRIFRMVDGGKGEELTVGAWIKACIAAYGLGQVKTTYDGGLTLKLLKQMHLHKIPMPDITADQLKHFRTLVTIDDETGLVTSLTPAPAAPVAVEPTAEKKSPQEDKNPSGPEKINIAITADPRPVNLADIFETPMMDPNLVRAYAPNFIQGYAGTPLVNYATNTVAPLPTPNVQIPE